MVNPVLLREMRGRWRRPLTFVVLLLYALILAVLMWLIYAWGVRTQTDFSGQAAAIEFGRRLFSGFLWMQTAVWMLLATALTATAISGERERGLLEGVLLSPLTAGQIVRGKIVASLWFISLLLLVPMPIAALCFTLGGLSPEEFLLSFVLLGGTALSGASLGLATSACHRRSDAALLTALIISLTLSWPPVIVALSFNADHFMVGALVCVVYQLILTAAALGVATDALNGLLPEREAEQGALFTDQPVYSAPLTHGAETTEPIPARNAMWQELPWAARIQFSNPVMQREVRARLRRRVEDMEISTPQGVEKRYAVSVGSMDWLVVGSVAMVLICLPAIVSGLGDLLAGLWVVFVAMTAAAFGSLTFSREREQHTLQPLLMSLLTPREVVAGKAGAACVLALIYAVPFFPLIALNFLTRPLLLLATVVFTAASGWLAAAIGLSFSWLCRQTSVAIACSLTCVLGIIMVVSKIPYLLAASSLPGRWLGRWPDFPVVAWWFNLNANMGLLRAAMALGVVFYLWGALLLAMLHRRLHPSVLEKDSNSVWSRDSTKDV